MTVSVDTEEDNWGSYAETGATTRNIEHLSEVQDRLARWGAHVTYLVNRPPLLDARSVEVLGTLSGLPGVEIGAHCHPWNTPPSTGGGAERSMMCGLPLEDNRAKVANITQCLRAELGVRPMTFRTGRWGMGPTVSGAIASEGYRVDSSVTPFIDWSRDGGPDYSTAPTHPYRFDPARPFTPTPTGSLVEIPTTVGFLGGRSQARSRLQRTLARPALRWLPLVGALDRLGVLGRRWLSPEQSNADEMIRLAEATRQAGAPVLDMTFHSCTLLPGATPFVRDEVDRERFVGATEAFLRHCSESGFAFGTLGEVGAAVSTAQGV